MNSVCLKILLTQAGSEMSQMPSEATFLIPKNNLVAFPIIIGLPKIQF